jgi:hypothetical protein
VRLEYYSALHGAALYGAPIEKWTSQKARPGYRVRAFGFIGFFGFIGGLLAFYASFWLY